MMSISVPRGLVISALALHSWLLVIVLTQALNLATTQMLTLLGI